MTVIERMITIQISIFFFFSTFCTIQSSFSDFFLNDYWSTESMAERDGYTVEIHNVTTEDGYILTVQRIPGSEGAQPILLVHGLLCNSALWLASGKERSLAYLLVDEGYDVWLGNVRGNTYGLNHVNLTTDDTEFWDFSYHEMAIYDLPAIIYYIQASTNQYPFYIGHSQGTVLFFVLGILRPDVANSLKLPISLAPVAYIGHIIGPLQRFALYCVAALYRVVQIFTNVQTFFTPSWRLSIFLLKLFCAVLSLGNYNCLNVVSSFLGYERPELFDMTILPAIVTNFPAGTSAKNMYFYAQHTMSGRFNLYDYGEATNLKLYNSSTPPEYDLKKITQPNGIFLGDSDIFVKFPDLNKLLQLVPNIVVQHVVNASGFTHMDFVWGAKSRDLVYNHVLKLVYEYNNQ
ncbi:lipase 3-like [Chelonus insularis]|uniref:lipase 3-like n=1 Tax=Chelonus insularis TaxID=460826 RepID=UPI00158DD5F0|nr:lipase 3-like [Chelonus insularis]